jgi:DNA-binding protein YbaB
VEDGSGTDEVLAEARAALRLVEQARTAVTSLVGRGRSPDGSVRARVGGDGLIETVRLRPEAMHLDSAALAGQVRSAVRSAQESFARQAGDVRANVLAGVLGSAGRTPDPARLAGVLGSAGRAPDPAALAGVLGSAGRAPDPARLAARLEEVQAHFVRRMEEFGRSLDALHRRLEG